MPNPRARMRFVDRPSYPTCDMSKFASCARLSRASIHEFARFGAQLGASSRSIRFEISVVSTTPDSSERWVTRWRTRYTTWTLG